MAIITEVRARRPYTSSPLSQSTLQSYQVSRADAAQGRRARGRLFAEDEPALPISPPLLFGGKFEIVLRVQHSPPAVHPGVLGKVGIVVPEGRVDDFGTFCCGGCIVVRLLGTVPPLVENCPDADEDALYIENSIF